MADLTSLRSDSIEPLLPNVKLGLLSYIDFTAKKGQSLESLHAVKEDTDRLDLSQSSGDQIIAISEMRRSFNIDLNDVYLDQQTPLPQHASLPQLQVRGRNLSSGLNSGSTQKVQAKLV